jgi:hypothetical protein
MKIPRYVLDAVAKRAKNASKFLENDGFISLWCRTQGLDVELTGSHVETITNPYGAANDTLEMIAVELERKSKS